MLYAVARCLHLGQQNRQYYSVVARKLPRQLPDLESWQTRMRLFRSALRERIDSAKSKPYQHSDTVFEPVVRNYFRYLPQERRLF